jgi:hypothetical protein
MTPHDKVTEINTGGEFLRSVIAVYKGNDLAVRHPETPVDPNGRRRHRLFAACGFRGDTLTPARPGI